LAAAAAAAAAAAECRIPFYMMTGQPLLYITAGANARAFIRGLGVAEIAAT
jgi:hypothetical protein